MDTNKGPIAGLIIASILATPLLAADNGWGWVDAPDATDQSAQITAWTEEDGSAAHYTFVAYGAALDIGGPDRDAKIVVLSGTLDAAGTALPPASFVTRAAGTASGLICQDTAGCRVFVETEPTTGAIENAHISVDALPWVEVPGTYGNVSLAWVWGARETPAPSSFFLKFKAGFPGFAHGHSHDYRGLVIAGDYRHWAVVDDAQTALLPGATFWQDGHAMHDDACGEGVDCIAYFRIADHFDVFPAE